MRKDNRSDNLPKSVVLGLGISGLGVARDLGREGVSIIGIDHKTFNIGHFSRYCEHLVSPDVSKSENDFLDFLIKIGKELHSPAVLFPTEDVYVIFMSRNRDALSGYYKFIMPEKTLCEEMLNKYAFFQLAKSHSLPVPATYRLDSINALKNISKDIEFPCIIKPLFSRKWKLGGLIKAVEVNDEKELLEKAEKLISEKNEVIIQEKIPGKDRDQFSYASYFDLHGECKAEFSARKIRQHPLGFGVGTLIESINEREVSEMGRAVVRELGINGISEVEFRKSSKTGELKLIEINLRPWTQNSLAAYCDANVIYFSYLDLIGRPLPKARPYRTGIKWINIFRDPIASLQYLLKGEVSVEEWIKSFGNIRDFSIFAADDIFPFLCLPLYLAYYFIGRAGNE